MEIFLSVVVFLITVTVLILVHEFGHYCAARCCGITVLRFSIGFGKALWRTQTRKGTEIVFAAIPVGGYVRLADESTPEIPLQQRFNQQSILKRLLVILSGSFCNVLFAVVVYWIVFSVGILFPRPVIGEVAVGSIAARAGLHANDELVAIADHTTPTWPAVAMQLISWLGDDGNLPITVRKTPAAPTQLRTLALTHWQLDSLHPDLLYSLGIIPYEPTGVLVVQRVEDTSAAAWAGIAVGDHILMIDRQPVRSWRVFKLALNQYAGKTVNFVIERAGQKITSVVDIAKETGFSGRVTGSIGVSLAPIAWPQQQLQLQKFSPIIASWPALQETGKAILFNVIIIKKMITGKISIQSLGGPLSILQSSRGALDLGLAYYGHFLALLSISLAVINLLPFPGLDGGYLIYLIVEAVRGRPLSWAVQWLVFRIGMIILLVLIVQTLINDVLRL